MTESDRSGVINERRTDRKLRLSDVTLTDIARVCWRYGIRLNFKLVRRWQGPWQLDQANGVWFRRYGDDGEFCVERSLDAA